MREILFRGKRVDNGEWVYGSYINSVVKNSVFGYIGGNNVIQPTQIIKKTLGQFTGCYDKKGKRVFEGDICQIKGVSYLDEKPFVIEWNEEFAGWFWKNLDCSATDTITAEIAETSEIIDNIHDNPEL